MNYAFFGSPEFAAIILEKALEKNLPPRFVVANPDRPFGRKKTITPPPVKLIASRYNIPVLQPEKLIASEFKFPIEPPDIFVIAAYSKIISKEILKIPKLGTIGVHPSLLPRYRGASPIQSAILAGEKESGVTLYLMDEEVDHGPILAEEKIRIEGLTTPEAILALSKLAGEMLVKFLPKFAAGELKAISQDHSLATFTKKFKTEDGYIDPEILSKTEEGLDQANMREIERKVRALNPEPGTWTMRDGKRLKLLEAKISPSAGVEKLRLTKIQWEGKKAQNI